MRISTLLLAGALLSGAQAFAQQDGSVPRGHKSPAIRQAVTTFAKQAPSRVIRKAASSPLTPPWQTDFKDEKDYALFTAIDANNDMTESGTLKNDAWNYNWGSLYFYSVNNTADDWLISPAFVMKAGTSYKVSVEVSCFRPHIMEIKWGQGTTVDAMTATGLESQSFKTNTTLEATIVPDADGNYNIGMHAVSEKGGYNMYVKSFKIEALASPLKPAEVTAATLTPDPAAKLQATIAFTAPVKASDNSDLKELQGVRIARGGDQVADLTDVAIGSEGSFTDTGISKAGEYEYTITPYNSYGDGAATTVKGWIGLDSPGEPENRVLKGGLNTLTLTWDTPQSAHDGVIFPDGISYDIYDVATSGAYYTDKLGTVTGTNTFTTNAVETETGEQHFHYLAIEASNDAGKSGAYISTPVIAGKPYELPVREGFSGGTVGHFWAEQAIGNGAFYNPKAGVYMSADEDADGNGHSLYLQTVSGDVVRFCSGKITLQGTADPYLVFQMKSKATSGSVHPYVLNPEGSRTQLDEIAVTSEDADWQTRQYSLSAYKDERWIQVGLEFDDQDNEGNQYVYFDNINVAEKAGVDLAADVEATPQIVRGDTAAVTVTVRNYGTSAVSASHLKVTVDGQALVDEDKSDAIPSFGYKKYTLQYVSSLLNDKDSLSVEAVVTTTGDAAQDNNTASTVIVANKPDLLSPTGLTLADTKLSWEAPATTKPVTDDFEGYAAWTTDAIGPWTAYDGDGGDCHGVLDNSYVYYTNENGPFAYIVYDASAYGDEYGTYDIRQIYPATAPASGKQALAAFHSYQFSMTTYQDELLDADNWLFSPQLSGEAQTISLKVNNFYESGEYQGTPYAYDYPETFDLMVSSTTNDKDAFSKLGETHEVAGGKWQTVEAALPEGTQYFAIHHNSKAQLDGNYPVSPFMFMIDDVTYGVKNQAVKGYKVYRDGQLVATVDATSLTDDSFVDGHLYQVTTVYEGDLESAPVSIDLTTGVRTVQSAGAVPVAVYTISGKQVSAPQHGINIVKYSDGTVRKVLK